MPIGQPQITHIRDTSQDVFIIPQSINLKKSAILYAITGIQVANVG